MKHQSPSDLDEQALKRLTMAELIEIILDQRHQFNDLKQKDEQENRQINQQVNQPTSTKPEWDKEGNPRKQKARKSMIRLSMILQPVCNES